MKADENTQTAHFALVGHPVNHSLSPRLHQLISEFSGQPCRYSLEDIAPDRLATDFPQDYDGLNVTVPHKQAVIPLLSGLTEEAARLGAVNTVHRGQGYNTDIMGLRRVLPELFGKTVLLIGYGGVAEALAAVALEAACAELIITGRSRDKAVTFSAKLAEKGWNKGKTTEIIPLSYDELDAALEANEFGIDLVLQATAAGMWPHCGDLPMPQTLLRKIFTYSKPYVFDSIYNPAATRFLLHAKAAGLETNNGLTMLFWQGLEARKIWQPDLDFTAAQLAMSPICMRLAADLRRNYPLKLVLGGFMGSGKTRLAKALAEDFADLLHVVDLDERIVQAAGMPIPQIFAEQGEAGFRALEARLLDEILAEDQQEKILLLAAGGGTVVQEGAADRIHEAGAQVLFLDVSLETVFERVGQGAKGRPMLADEDGEAFARKTVDLYNQRKPLYEAAADFTLNADLPLDQKKRDFAAALGWQ